MQGADSVILTVVIISVIVGAVRGFIREIVAIASWLVAIWVSWRFSGFMHPYLESAPLSDEQRLWLARGIVLLIVLLIGALIGHVLSWLTHTAAGLGLMDRALGFLFGLTRGAVLVGFAVLLGQHLRLEHATWWEHSKLMPYGEYVAGWIRGFAGESQSLARRAFGHGAGGE